MSIPKRILILDAFCSAHVGNDVLLDSSLQLIERIWPGARVTIHAKVPDSFRPTLGVDCKPALFSDLPDGGKLTKLIWTAGVSLFMVIQFINSYTLKLPPYWLTFSSLRRQALRDVHAADVAVSIGGEMINDDFRKTLLFYLFLFILPTRWHAKTVIFPQSIGPLRRRWTRVVTRWGLKRCAVITARDQPSVDELKGLGFHATQAMFSPDVGIAQPMAPVEEARNYLQTLGVVLEGDRFWIGVTPSNWLEEGISRKNYLEVLIEAFEKLSTQRPIGIIIMPANLPLYGCRPKDRDTSLWLRDQLQGTCPVFMRKEALMSARLFKSVTSVLDLFISTRMHAAILSTNAFTPTITINTQRKLRGYMANIGQECCAIDVNQLTPEDLSDTMARMLDDQKTIRKQLKVGHKKLEQQLGVYAEQLATSIS